VIVDLRSLIAKRAVRSYRDEPVPVDTVRQIVDQARWTGSARNRQPWRFAAVYEAGIRAELARLGEYAGHLAAAPVVLVLLSPAERWLDTEFDLGRVAQSITIVATSMGLGSCVVSLYPDGNARRAAALVHAESGWVARHAIALGHPGPRPSPGRLTIPTGRHSTDQLLRIH
jgi:nitroreductase